MKTFIYVLVDPQTQEPRYVGKSDNPSKRLAHHCTAAKRERSRKACWIRSLLSKGLRPALQILEEVDIGNWENAEVHHIARMKEQGHNLTNGDSGGRGGKQASDELRRRLSDLRRGHKHSETTRQLISESHRGMKHTSETRVKMSKSHTSLVASDDTRQKMSAAHTGKKHTEETKMKCSVANKGRVFSEEHRRKLSEAASKRRAVSQSTNNI